ncbi:hypothetical protein LTR37_003429 [Vermiconidia calcicola]|uniref:Uncharacterized protein n=1 Tax=Vermiconidia calcicola TaxID=1690605 RepID=A0ACC3NT34_9PEZI|nr:hypothetical protein LTR37_003429 [Vermiconidia calcicola]
MPLNANEEALLGEPSTASLEHDHQRVDHAPREQSKIGRWSLIALILNRTIGSGIFLTPHRVLAGTGCVGGALFLWTLGALISLCGLYVWLECGLSMPQRRVQGEMEPRGVPRSGGEKNFLEFMFPNDNPRLPHIRTTCSFAIMFILMYNLSGNALSFGLQVMTASGRYNRDTEEVPDRATAIGIAIAALSLVVLLHTFSRKGGILLNNIFAIIKVALLLAIIGMGIAKALGWSGGSADVIKNNFTKDVWKTQRSDVASWSDSLMLCMYAFSGFEQPFYVLAETKSPRKYFPRYTVLAMLIAMVLFFYLLVVDKGQVLPQTANGPPNTQDLATLFFDRLFADEHEKATRAMAAIIAVSIFGNLWVMTFTAARVKQEIAKEGILPWSLYIASAYRTPYGLMKSMISRSKLLDEEVEQAPTLAFGLHWLTSVFLIAVTAPITDPRRSYSVLVSLYTYTIVTVLGCWVSFGLLLTKARKSNWHWQQRRRYRPWLSPAHAIIYFAATAFMLVATFIPPQRGSPFHESVSGLPWYVVPLIGITAPLWGLLWFWGLLMHQWRIGRQLVVRREAYWAPDPDFTHEYVQLAEIVDHTWQIKPRDGMCDDFVQPEAGAVGMEEPLVTECQRAANIEDGPMLETGRDGGWNMNRNQRDLESRMRRASDGFND